MVSTGDRSLTVYQAMIREGWRPSASTCRCKTVSVHALIRSNSSSSQHHSCRAGVDDDDDAILVTSTTTTATSPSPKTILVFASSPSKYRNQSCVQCVMASVSLIISRSPHFHRQSFLKLFTCCLGGSLPYLHLLRTVKDELVLRFN